MSKYESERAREREIEQSREYQGNKDIPSQTTFEKLTETILYCYKY